MSERTRWWLVRHAPVVGAQDLFYGDSDVPADVSDDAMFAAFPGWLPDDAVWLTSGLQRTEQTADAIAAAGVTQDERFIEPDLAEQRYGEWEMKRYDDLAMDLAKIAAAGQWHRYWLAPADHRPPGGESFLDVIHRVGRALERHTESYRGRSVVAVIHGGTIRAAIAYAMNMEPDRALSIAVENLGTTRLDHMPGEGLGGDWRLAFSNSRAG